MNIFDVKSYNWFKMWVSLWVMAAEMVSCSYNYWKVVVLILLSFKKSVGNWTFYVTITLVKSQWSNCAYRFLIFRLYSCINKSKKFYFCLVSFKTTLKQGKLWLKLYLNLLCHYIEICNSWKHLVYPWIILSITFTKYIKW